MTSSGDIRSFGVALTDLTEIRRYPRFISKKRHSSPSAPMIDFSTSTFSFVALSSSSLAILLTSLPSNKVTCVRLLGILVDKPGNIVLRTKLSMMEKEGLMDAMESKTARIGEVLPFREPKSCEKPPMPIPSRLIWEIQCHDGTMERRRRIGRHIIHPSRVG